MGKKGDGHGNPIGLWHRTVSPNGNLRLSKLKPPKAEANFTLGFLDGDPSEYSGRDSRDAAINETSDAEINQYEVAHKAVRSAVRGAGRGAFPTANAARFTGFSNIAGDYALHFEALTDVEGEPIHAPESDRVHYAELSAALNDIGRAFTSCEYTGSTFGTHQDGLFMDVVAVRRSASEINAGRDSRAARAAREAVRDSELSVEGLAVSVHDKFTIARTAHFKDTPFQTQPFELVSVSDGDGNTLWEMKAEINNDNFAAAYEWSKSMNKYVGGISETDPAMTRVKHYGADVDLGEF
jgi:hypothetical protein